MIKIERGSVWLRHAFLLPISDNQNMAGSRSRRRHSTSAAYKFTNTTLGGNYAMNNPPQFTHWADIRQPGRGRSDEDWKEGMGRYYSEAIDDPKQIIHMSFGVPRFSSWTSFFANFYDRHAALLANTGRVSDNWYNMGLAGGYIVSLPIQPLILGFTAVNRIFSFLSKNSPSKWYYFHPTMHSYWSTVNTIANDLAINMGIIPRVFSSDSQELQDDRNSRRSDAKIDGEQMAATFSSIAKGYPSLFRPGGGVDVMSLARRTERMSMAAQEAMRNLSDTSTNVQDFQKKVIEHLQQPVDAGTPMYKDTRAYFDAYIKNVSPVGTDPLEGDNKFSEWSELEGIYRFITASQRDGSQFVSFRVNHNGSVSESFSNSTRDSDIAQELNAKVSQGRQASFNFMGGNITSLFGGAVDAIKSFAAGALDSVNLGGLATLTGTAFIDIPKLWDGSTANLPQATYTIPLPSPYGNKLSRYINLMLPISMILAGGLPLAAGRSSYTSPFICQIYHQGRVQCQLGLIDSISITRGTGNVGWNAEHEMLGAEITISVVDLSSIMYVPIKGGFKAGNIVSNAVKKTAMSIGNAVEGDQGAAIAAAVVDGTVWDEHSTFSDYMAVLAGMSLADTYYIGNRLNLNLTRSVTAFNTWRSPSNFMSWALDSQPARVLSAFAQFSDRF